MVPVLKSITSSILVAALASTVACANGPQAGPPTAPITEAEIRAANEEWLQAERSDDGTRAGAIFAADGILVTARGRVDGQAAIQQFWGDTFAAEPGSSGTTLRVVKWAAGGDIGYVLGRFEGGVISPAGHWLSVVQRQEDGSAKIVAQISIPDPAPAR